MNQPDKLMGKVEMLFRKWALNSPALVDDAEVVLQLGKKRARYDLARLAFEAGWKSRGAEYDYKSSPLDAYPIEIEEVSPKIAVRDRILEAENRMLRKALSFYADAYKVQVTYSNYPDERSYDTYNDDGHIARLALRSGNLTEIIRESERLNIYDNPIRTKQ